VVLIAQRPALLRKKLKADPGNVSDVPGFFLAHELAHQWWGDGVAGRSYHDRWLSEASAHYAAALWARRSRGEEVFRGVMRDMAQWALSRNDAGPISLGYRIGHLERDSTLFRAIVYDKGACVLHTLRHMLGDAAFSRGLVRFQERFRFQKAGTPQFREVLEESGGVDLRPYFEAWIYGTEVPTLTFGSETQAVGRRFVTTLTVSATDLPGPVPLSVSLQKGGRRETRVVTLPREGGSWRIETDFRPERVRLNEDASLLVRVREGAR
jgi:aminopeptidase N